MARKRAKKWWKTVYFCSVCKTQLDVAGWGSRAECPVCEKMVIITERKVPIVANERGKVL